MDTSPVSKVFAIPKLLEHILLYVHDAELVNVPNWILKEHHHIHVLRWVFIGSIPISLQLFTLQKDESELQEHYSRISEDQAVHGFRVREHGCARF